MIKKLLWLLAAVPGLAMAADFDGAQLSLLWAAPFAGLLLSIALFPIFAPGFWHHHFGKISAFWAAAFLLPFIAVYGVAPASGIVAHAILDEYVPFILILFALYTVSGGILVRGNLHGSPALNTGILAFGTVIASLMGTTGAAMLLIRPLLRANDNRQHNVHVVVFFIFLVANIGGGLTPLGDPPLFLGFLKGIDFLWTVEHMLAPVAFAASILLVMFYVIDSYFYKKEGILPIDKTPDSKLQFFGLWNFALIAAIVGCVVMSGVWKPGIAWHVLGTELALQDLMRDVLLVVIALISLKLTPKQVRAGNDFNWGPILEVAKLFAAIFIAMAPAIAILRAGSAGEMADLVKMVSTADGAPINYMYFWMTGILSAFLDNAPTYLVFFNLAHGDAEMMMGPMASTLLAISVGAVFMGALSYIGNAPNFMVKAVAEDRGVKMPSFFGYMAWSCVCLLPVFILMTFVFF